jgi:HSP20 family protein
VTCITAIFIPFATVIVALASRVPVNVKLKGPRRLRSRGQRLQPRNEGRPISWGKTVAIYRADSPKHITPKKAETHVKRMNAMFDTISRRAFELFESNGRILGHDVEDWFKAETELFHPLHINVTATGEAVEVRAEVPGLNEKELEISVEPRRLTILGKRETAKEEKKGKIVYSETCSNQVFRVVDLPVEVVADKAEAALKNGMLQLTIPKVVAAKTIKVHAKTAAA